MYTAEQKFIRTSARKIRFVADGIAHLTPQQAVRQLKFSDKRAAAPLSRAHSIFKRTSHIKITLTSIISKLAEEKIKPVAKPAIKKTAKPITNKSKK